MLTAEKIRVIKFGEVEEIFILVRRDGEMILIKFVLEIEIMRLATLAGDCQMYFVILVELNLDQTLLADIAIAFQLEDRVCDWVDVTVWPRFALHFFNLHFNY